MRFNSYFYLLFNIPCFAVCYKLIRYFYRKETTNSFPIVYTVYILNGLILGWIGALLAAKIEFLLDSHVTLQPTFYAYFSFFFAGQRWDGAFLFVLIYYLTIVKHKIQPKEFTPYFNSICLTSCLLYAVGKVGCFLAGHTAECSGSPSNLPWAVVVPPLTYAMHPRQLYDAIFHVLLFGGMILITKPQSKWRYLTYIIISPVYCAFSDLLSMNSRVFWIFTSSQLIDLTALFVVLLSLAWETNSKRIQMKFSS